MKIEVESENIFYAGLSIIIFMFFIIIINIINSNLIGIDKVFKEREKKVP